MNEMILVDKISFYAYVTGVEYGTFGVWFGNNLQESVTAEIQQIIECIKETNFTLRHSRGNVFYLVLLQGKICISVTPNINDKIFRTIETGTWYSIVASVEPLQLKTYETIYVITDIEIGFYNE